MKKKYYFFVLILTSFNLFSQASLGYKKIDSKKCKVDHTCRAEYKTDTFENTITYKIGFYETALSLKGLSYVLIREVKENKDERFQLLLFGVKKGCRTENSFVHIQFKNGEKLKIPTANSKIECGTSALSIDISNYLEILSKETIEKIRIHIDFDDDFEITEKGQKKFFSNLECIQQFKEIDN